MSVQLLKDAITTGAQSPLAIGRTVKDHAIEIAFTGDITALEVALEGSSGGANFHSLGSYILDATDIAAGKAMFTILDKPVDHVRINPTTLTRTSTGKAQAYWSGHGA